MNLLFLSHHCCIRTVKEGLGLIEAGHSVIFLHSRVANPDMQNVLPLMSFYQGEAQLRQKLSTFTDIDLIHVHNDPSDLGWITKEVRPDLPMVFDCHDLNCIRLRRIEQDEVKTIEAADGVVFPSMGYQKYCQNELKYVLPSLADTPREVIYSMGTRQMTEIPEMTRTHGIVYEGRTTIDHGNKDYRGLVNDLSGMGIPVYIFPSNMNNVNFYSQAGAVMMPTLGYVEMLRQLTRFDWGFSGPAIRTRDGDRGMPNKLFEYVAAGIPVIVHQANEAAEFVEANGLGIAVEDIDEIADRYNEHELLREQIREKRRRLVMENQVEKLLALYEAAMKKAESAKLKAGSENPQPETRNRRAAA